LCLEAGASAVFGLDLNATLPLEGHNFRWYKPPMVHESDDELRYIQLPSSFITSGDWTDPDVASHVLKSVLSTCIIIIDIQAGKTRLPLSVLAPVIEARWKALIIVRMYLTIDEAEWIASDLSAGGGIFQIYPGAPLRSEHATQSFVFHISQLPDSGCIASQKAVLISCVDWELCEMPFMGGGRDFLMGALVFNTVSVPTPATVSSLRNALVEVVLASHGDYLSRPSYSHWSLLLYGLVACDFMLGSETYRVRTLRRLLNNESIIVRAGTLALEVKAHFKLIRHLSKVAARLL